MVLIVFGRKVDRLQSEQYVCHVCSHGSRNNVCVCAHMPIVPLAGVGMFEEDLCLPLAAFWTVPAATCMCAVVIHAWCTHVTPL